MSWSSVHPPMIRAGCLPSTAVLEVTSEGGGGCVSNLLRRFWMSWQVSWLAVSLVCKWAKSAECWVWVLVIAVSKFICSCILSVTAFSTCVILDSIMMTWVRSGCIALSNISSVSGVPSWLPCFGVGHGLFVPGLSASTSMGPTVAMLVAIFPGSLLRR